MQMQRTSSYLPALEIAMAHAATKDSRLNIRSDERKRQLLDRAAS
jgi:hypothetical protein